MTPNFTVDHIKMNILIFIAFIKLSENVQILGVFPQRIYSHHILTNTLMEELAKRGHNVTVVSSYPNRSFLNNLTTIQFAESCDTWQENGGILGYYSKQTNIFSRELIFNKLWLEQTDCLLNDEAVRRLLKSKESFDLVIYHDMSNHALLGFCYYYKTSCIEFTTIGLSKFFNAKIGNPMIPSYVPDYRIPFGNKISFQERAYNAIVNVFLNTFRELLFVPQHNILLKKYFPEALHINSILYNISMVLMNSHVSISRVVPILPNVIGIGKYHIKPPKKLPKDLQEILDGAKNGAIYFSMGSVMKSANMPRNKLEFLLNTFSGLNHTVIWKYENRNLSIIPTNVKIIEWLPQSDLLAHSNIKLFISHCGMLSITEAIYHGVPVLGLPAVADQSSNAMHIVRNGAGLSIGNSYLTDKLFFEAIQEILSNTSYKANAMRLSRIMHDRPAEPLDEAMFWIEHTIRHGGGLHIRSKALDLSWFQYLLLDVIALFLTIIVLIMIVLYCTVKVIFKVSV